MKMLKSKNIRRICVLFAMLAPVVYLFGSLFAGLTGAHGEQVFAEPVYVDEYIETDSFVPGRNYRLDNVASLESALRSSNYQRVYTEGLYFNSQAVNSWSVFVESNSHYFGIYTDSNTYYIAVAYPTSYTENQRPWVFSGDVSSIVVLFDSWNVSYDLAVLTPVPSDETPVNAGANNDYVFKNFFAKDNFLEQIGKDVLSDTPHGFVPFASFWKYLDNNMLHMGDMQLGLMGYGYVYYCCHVLLFDIAFILVTFFLDFIQKVNDKIVGGVD